MSINPFSCPIIMTHYIYNNNDRISTFRHLPSRPLLGLPIFDQDLPRSLEVQADGSHAQDLYRSFLRYAWSPEAKYCQIWGLSTVHEGHDKAKS